MLRAPNMFRARTVSGETKEALNALSTSPENNSTDVARRRQAKKDETIRKKAEQELNRISRQPSRRGRDKTPPPRVNGGTVGNLRPLPAILLRENDTAYDAARLMTVRRADAVLVTDSNDQLSGIVTDKDLAFRVIAEGYEPHSTALGDIMTRNPCTVTTSHNATDALNEMVNGGFRHLPVTDSRTDEIAGILDITECLLDALTKLERASRSTKQLSDVLDTMSEFEASHNREVAAYVRVLREQLGLPRLDTVLDPTRQPAEVSCRTSAREAARAMKEFHQTATLVVEDGKIVGIFTSKDLVVRVIAGKLEPSTTSIVRVMTPNPDLAPPDMTILDALRTMQEGRYQHLPLHVKETGIMGTVDILQLTYTTLKAVQNMENKEGDGPVWNKFWSAMAIEDNASDRTLSEPRIGVNGSADARSVKGSTGGSPSSIESPPLAASINRRFSSSTRIDKLCDDDPSALAFKFTDPISQQTHRISIVTHNFSELVSLVRSKIPALDESDELSVSYVDDEKDRVLMANDEDLFNAVTLARNSRWSLIRLVIDIKKATNPIIIVSDAPGSRNTQNTGNQNAAGVALVTGGSLAVGVAIGACLVWAFARSIAK